MLRHTTLLVVIGATIVVGCGSLDTAQDVEGPGVATGGSSLGTMPDYPENNFPDDTGPPTSEPGGLIDYEIRFTKLNDAVRAVLHDDTVLSAYIDWHRKVLVVRTTDVESASELLAGVPDRELLVLEQATVSMQQLREAVAKLDAMKAAGALAFDFAGPDSEHGQVVLMVDPPVDAEALSDLQRAGAVAVAPVPVAAMEAAPDVTTAGRDCAGTDPCADRDCCPATT